MAKKRGGGKRKSAAGLKHKVKMSGKRFGCYAKRVKTGKKRAKVLKGFCRVIKSKK